jgi:hypothetical protein
MEKPTQNVARKWWFWTAVGGVLVAAGGIGGIVWRVENPPPVMVPVETGSALRTY